MKILRSCEIERLNWGALPELSARLARLGVDVTSVSLELDRFPDSITYESFEKAYQDVQEHGPPEHYYINVHGKGSEGEFTLRIHRSDNIRGQEILLVTAEGIRVSKDMDEITDFLGLKPTEPVALPPEQPRTAFIAHRFDDSGVDCADKLARFLELIGFTVVTGRAYAPKSVAEKVRGRIDAQAVLFVILTAGSDDTWLIQESILGDIKGKPLIIVRERDFDYKSGILADHEYIPFTLPHIEMAFIPILEGLRELGYLDF